MDTSGEIPKGILERILNHCGSFDEVFWKISRILSETPKVNPNKPFGGIFEKTPWETRIGQNLKGTLGGTP